MQTLCFYILLSRHQKCPKAVHGKVIYLVVLYRQIASLYRTAQHIITHWYIFCTHFVTSDGMRAAHKMCTSNVQAVLEGVLWSSAIICRYMIYEE